MKVLTLPKNLEIGGTQVNAVDLAVALQTRGHEVLVASQEGPMRAKLSTHGVPVEDLPGTEHRIGRVSAIANLIRRFRPDVIHGYEVRGILDASYASRLANGPPVLGSILSTRVPWYLPETTPITVGMPSLLDFTSNWRTGPVTLIDPPVVHYNADAGGRLPGLDSLNNPSHLVVLVSRLVEPFKKEGILRTISSMRLLESEGFGLLIVGDGAARSLYEAAARDENTLARRSVVSFAGELLDPAPAFAAASVVIGNGTSVLQAAAAGTPSVVTGREGFSTVVSGDVLDALYYSGFYGVGQGVLRPDPLPDQIRQSVTPSRRVELGTIKERILSRYGVEVVAGRMEQELVKASELSRPSWADLERSAVRLAYYRIARARLRAEARRQGLQAENADNFVYGRLRDMALPPGRFGTGRNRRRPMGAVKLPAFGPSDDLTKVVPGPSDAIRSEPRSSHNPSSHRTGADGPAA